MFKTHELTLDTERALQPKFGDVFAVNTNDYESVKFKVRLQQDGAPVDLANATVKLAIRKPDKAIVYQNGIVDNATNGECSFILATAAYELSGSHAAEVMIYFETGGIVVARSFVYQVTQGVMKESAIKAANFWQDVHELNAAVEHLQSEVEQALAETEEARQAATRANTAAETADAATLAANTAADNANDSADNADAKAQIAQTAATNADMAAQTANQRVTELDGFETSIVSQLADTAKVIGVSKKPSKNFPLESSKIITYCDAEVITVFRGTLSNQTPYSMEFEATQDLTSIAPGLIALKPHVRSYDLSSDYFEVAIRALGYSFPTSFDMRIFPDGAQSSQYYQSPAIEIPKNMSPNELMKLRVHRSQFTASATPPAAGFALTSTGYIQLRIGGASGMKIRIEKGIVGVNVKTPTMIQFDDGRISVYEKAFPLMKERGIVGTFNVVTSWFGTPGYCTVEQLQEMQDAGWSICNHTHTHQNLSLMNQNDAIVDIETAHRLLTRNGFTGAEILAPPFNAFTDALRDRVRHVIKTRKYGTLTQSPVRFSEGYVNLHSRSIVVDENPVDIHNDYLTAAAVGNYYSICFHVIGDDAGAGYEYSFSVEKFEQLLDLLVSENAYFCTLEQYVDRYLISR